MTISPDPAGHDGLLAPAHLRLLRALVHVVVAQQVQHGVYRQIRQLPAVGVPVLLRLRLYPLHGDDHIPQGHIAGAGVGVLHAGQLTGRQLELREAQHVGGAIHPPHVQIDGVDARVARDQHVHLAGKVHPLGGQRRADDLAEKAPRRLTDAGHVGGDGYIVSLHFFFSSNLA